MTKVSNR